MIVPLTVNDFINRTTKLYANKIAIIDGNTRFTYKDIGDRIECLANGLKKIGVRKGDRIVYITDNSHYMIEAYFAVPMIGAILIPLNVQGTRHDFYEILKDATPSAIFAQPKYARTIEPVVKKIGGTKNIILPALKDTKEDIPEGWKNYEEIISPLEHSLMNIMDNIDENDVAEIFYTSGVTGEPRGVMLTHRNIYFTAFNTLVSLHLSRKDIFLHAIPFYQANAWGAIHFITAIGATHVILNEFSPESALKYIETHNVTKTFMTPAMISDLVNSPFSDDYKLKSLELILTMGGSIPVSFIETAKERLKVNIQEGYGLIETGPLLYILHPRMAQPDAIKNPHYHQSSSGVPLSGITTKAIDDSGKEVAHDGKMVGEMIVRSNTVMKGYWDKQSDTSEVMKDGWFHTGDLVVVEPTGYIKIVDRRRDIILSGGEQVISLEIENLLCSHPAVQRASVLAIPNTEFGEVIRAIIMLDPNYKETTAEELKDYCTKNLASFKVPKQIDITDSLPTSIGGKILKASLKKDYLPPLPK